MSTVSDVENISYSNLNHIDSLLNDGPGWNFVTGIGNTVSYTFSVASGNETGNQEIGVLTAFSAAQQSATRAAFSYISALTGIKFVETATGSAAQVHLASTNLAGASTSGLCSWNYSYRSDQNQTITSYTAAAYVYLDNQEWGGQNANLGAGSRGYETLLHELGHMLGLKHPFSGTPNLPASQDSTFYTLMAYESSGGPYSSFRAYDVAALNWLYGGDGLAGAVGVGSSSGARYITGTGARDTLTGTTANDLLQGDAGNDTLNGGAGTDTAIFAGERSGYTLTQIAGGTSFQISGGDGIDVLSSVELLRFSNGTFTLAQVLDSSAPAAPTQALTVSAAGYVAGNKPTIAGSAEAGATVQVYNGVTLLGAATAQASGAWSLTPAALADGSYSITATATDAAGNVSAASAAIAFKVDTRAPAVPSLDFSEDGSAAASGNQPDFSGTAEAGTSVELFNGAASLGTATANAAGGWSLAPAALADGSYSVSARAVDAAGNASAASAAVSFRVLSSLNQTGSDGADQLVATAGNNHLDGGAGLDTVVYASGRAGFTVAASSGGFVVTDTTGAQGTDQLAAVERVQFSDTSVGLDIAGSGGQAYRLYQAAFDRQPDAGGLGFWLHHMDRGLSLREAAAGFMSSPEFINLYGSNPTNEAFVTRLYDNVLHRQPEAQGFQFWLDYMATPEGTRANVLAYFSESPENQAQVIGSIQNGFDYIPLA